MPSLPAERRGPKALITNAKGISKATNSLWGHSVRAPMYAKATEKQMHNGRTKKVFRRRAGLSGHAYASAASGAAATAAAVLAKEAGVLRLGVERGSSRAPWLPSISVGAKQLLEAFLVALAQEAGYKASLMTEAAGKKRITTDVMSEAWSNTQQSVFGNSALLKRVITSGTQAPPKSKPKLEKEGEKTEKKRAAKVPKQAGDLSALTE